MKWCGQFLAAFFLLLNLLAMKASSTRISADSIPDCSAEVLELAPCLAFVSDQVPSPPQLCCDALETVVMSTPVCLCELVSRGKNGTANTGLPSVNLTLVRQLPKDCGIETAVQRDESQCHTSVHAAPAPSPSHPEGSAGAPTLVRPLVFGWLGWVTFISSVPILTKLCSLSPHLF